MGGSGPGEAAGNMKQDGRKICGEGESGKGWRKRERI